jgi:medium-chain acyl-[acyl-carrier-protein] hydrolase
MTDSTATSRWLATSPRQSAAVRLFCFPYAGGGSTIFHSWHAAVPRWLQICPLELPGRGRRFDDAPFERIPDLVAAAGAALLPVLHQPFALFGHSFGALVAFELARWLRARGAPLPQRLIVSGHRAPQLPSRRRALSGLTERELVDELRDLEGTPPALLDNPELLELVLPVLRADFAACDHYQYADAAPLALPISAFGGASDPAVDETELEAWRAQTTAALTPRMVPGNHFFIHDHQSLLSSIVRDLAAPPSLALGDLA